MLSLSAFDLTPSVARGREWLLANGLGGYSSSTAIGMNTRKYHGLLVASLKGGRQVLLSKLEETATADGEEILLSTNEYPGKFYPEGFKRQVGFEFAEHPKFIYSVEGGRLEKSVRMLHGKNAVVVSYRLASGRDIELSIRPLLFPRGVNSDPMPTEKRLGFEADRFGFGMEKPVQLRMGCSHGKFIAAPDNYRNLVYSAEKERGYAFTETLFSPGVFSAKLQRGDELHLAASVEGLAPSEALDLLDRQAFRRSHMLKNYTATNGIDMTDFSDALLQSADSFVNSDGKRHWITAGFHWFSEWGRDSMISLPGLLLCTGRHALAREVLAQHASRMEDGLLPNFIDEQGRAQYNSSDASLWYLNAIREYVEWTGDYAFVQQKLWKSMRSLLSAYMHGNQLVKMDGDCLLRVLSPASTWMDAQVEGRPVTPRKGKPVEINALWHSGLCFMHELAVKFGDRRTAGVVAPLIEGAGESFQKFMSAHDDSQLFDLIEPNDPTLRPNQLFAVCLPHSPLNELQKKHVFNLIRSRLYTPLGLYSLAPQDERFRNAYSGGPSQRDSAYHQGMIWPWLLGAFYDAHLAIYPGSERQVLASLKPVWEAMKLGCAGTLPELYEPKAMLPAGAVSQAWSVAEVLRIYTKVKRTATAVNAQARGLAIGAYA